MVNHRGGGGRAFTLVEPHGVVALLPGLFGLHPWCFGVLHSNCGEICEGKEPAVLNRLD